MRILVAGGAGYIGSTVAWELVQAGHQVTVIDSLVTGSEEAVPAGAAFIHADIHDRVALGNVFAGGSFDAVMHFAAFIEAGESMSNPGKYFGNNVTGSIALIEAASGHGVRRFVFSSTAAVYAGKDVPLRESDPLGPANAYGASKLMVEQVLSWYGCIHGLRYACLRYFNACGARPGHGEAHNPETHLIPLVLQVALGRRPHISVYGADYPTPDGTCVRDYIHVLDLSRAHLLAVEALEREPSLTLNMGNGSGYSVRQVIQEARRVTGHSIPAVEVPRRPGDAPVLVADASEAGRLLGWTPSRPAIADIIRDAWQWHSGHPAGYC